LGPARSGSLTIFGWQAQADQRFAIRRAELDSL